MRWHPAVRFKRGVHMENMEIVFDNQPGEKEIAFLERQLLDFNCSTVQGYSYEHFIIKGVDSPDSIIAGIHGQIGGGWLCIASLWVGEDYRGKGIGKRLLFLAEKEASERNCRGAYLYTYSFQSPRFYEKQGYRIFGELEHFSGGHTKYFMKKRLG